MQQKQYRGVLVGTLVALAPCLLWLVLSDSRNDPLIKLTGLAALSLLSFNIILSARVRFLENLFYGLDKLYRAHRMLGGIVVMLVATHASLITLKYWQISPATGFDFLTGKPGFALLAGRISLFLLIGLVSVTVYFRIRYQWFVVAMRLLGISVFTAGYHALFISGSDVRDTPALFIYMAVIGGPAATVYIYRSIFHRPFTARFSYQVEQIIPHDAITEVWLRPVGKALNRYAGQFAFVQFISKGVKPETHPFTIATGSDDERLRFCMKNLGDYTSTLGALGIGDLATVEGPYGQFSFTKIRSQRQAWIAGGIGITPFLAMAHSLSSECHVTLFYWCVMKKRQFF